MTSAFELGKQAAKDGKSLDSNPYVTGYTKLGAPKLSEEGIEWANGFGSVGRVASKQEVAAAKQYDVSQFRRKSNKHYQR